MTIKECIDNVDSIKPNQYTIKEKVMWLSFIEEIIINDVLKTHEGYDGRYDDFEGYTEDKLSVPLIVPSPYDRLYTAYLKMQIDNENGEMARYNNSAALYNAYMLEYKKHYNKTHMPLDTTGKREAKPSQKTQVGLSDAEYENIVKDLTFKLTEYFSDYVSPDKLYSIVNSYIQNNIELLKGKDGYTPKKGVDYWSEADVHAITEDIRNMCEEIEKARLAAETAKETALGYKGDVERARNDVQEAKVVAQEANEAAQNANGRVNAIADSLSIYQIPEMRRILEDTQTAKIAAEEAKENIQTAENQASQYAESAQMAKGLAQTAKTDAERAKADAESARDIAINKALEAKGFSEEAYDYYAGISTMKREVEESRNDVLSAQSDVATKHKEVMEFQVETIPDYIKTEAKAVADNVVATRDAYSFVFGGVSDLHTTGSDISAEGVLHAGQGMNEINKCTALDLVMNFGDVVLSDMSHTKGFPYVRSCFDDVTKGVPYIQMQGNHDEYDSAYTDEQEKQKYFAYIGANNVGTVTDWENRFRNYGYRDFDSQKMRVIYLNSVDTTSIENDCCYISKEQFTWLINTALDFSNKSDAENWALIVCCHHPLNWYGNSMTNLLAVLDAYIGKQRGNITADNTTIAYDFSDVKAKFISHFHGHTHNFRYEKLGTNGVLTITIPNACFNRNNEYGTSSSYSDYEHETFGDVDENGNQRQFNKTADTVEDTAFNIVVIDRTNETIHCFKYGAGIDREIYYGGYVDIINIPNEDYFDNTRISTSATTIDTSTKAETGYVTTRLIDVSTMGNKNNKVVIRTEGVDFSADKSVFTSYLDDGTVYKGNNISALAGMMVDNFALDESGNLTITLDIATMLEWCKFKICGYGLGENLIVTINQEIT